MILLARLYEMFGLSLILLNSGHLHSTVILKSLYICIIKLTEYLYMFLLAVDVDIMTIAIGFSHIFTYLINTR